MKRKLAVLTAMALCLSSVPMTSSTVFAEDNISDSVSAISPNVSWLPTTLDEYEAFIAEYGSVLVHNNHIVFCGEVNYSTGDSVFIQQSGTAEIEIVKSYIIEEPTSDGTPPPVGNSNYIVQVYQAVSAGTVDLTILRGREWDENAPKETLDFGRYEVAEDLMITEIDNTRYGIGVSVLPNKTEYAIGEELDLTGLRINGSITTFEDGEELQGCIIDEDYFDLIESGNDIRVDSSEFNNQKAGTYNIYVSFGNAKDAFKVTVVDGRMGYTKGDVNADSKFTVADVVMLQKWLLGVPDVTLTNWKAADLCEDGELNVFDLCMMKRELISQKQIDGTPVLYRSDEYYLVDTPTGRYNGESVISADGNKYEIESGDCQCRSTEQHLNHIKSGEKTEYITDSEVLQKLSEFSKNASKYENCEIKYYPEYVVLDYGQTDISVVYVDGKGNTQELNIYGYGECYCLDAPEAIELIKLLIEKEYIPGRDFLSYMLSDSKSQITMGDVIELAEKGSDMRLADLEGFECVDIGAGNHTFLYDTADGRFRLSIGSANGKDIGYAKLECFESGEIIDISKESVEEFYNKNTFIAEKDVVMPDVEVEYGMPFGIRGGDSGLYAAPSTDAPVSAYIPKWNMLHEIGYQEGNNDWIFTEYNGIKGWVRVKDDKGNSNLEYMAAPAKPVIYLYPEQETDVHVELDLKNATLSTTYPKYKNGWDVTAMPDGTLINKVDGTKHSYLFWDACNDSTRYDFSKGFCVAGEDTEAFLKEKLTYMGLNEQEMNEFIVYWLPLMEHNAYNLISFQTDAYTDNAKLNITPNPDSLLRIFMTYIPLDEAVEIAPQQLETFERKGFTVVEWGGTKIG